MNAISPAGPMSPCINVCSLDEQGFCRGCYRTRDEIGAWSRLTPAQQWDVLARLDARRPAAARVAAG